MTKAAKLFSTLKLFIEESFMPFQPNPTMEHQLANSTFIVEGMGKTISSFRFLQCWLKGTPARALEDFEPQL